MPSSCLIDGGVLNNEPFKPVLDAISERRVDGDVERVLMYVAPSAARLDQEKIGRLPCNEVAWADTLIVALNYPRESNLRNSTEDLSLKLLTSVSDSQETLFQRMRTDDAKATTYRERATAFIDEYRLRRAAAVVWDVRQRMSSGNTVRPLTPHSVARAESILRDDRPWMPPAGADALQGPDLDSWEWGVAPAERVIRLLLVDLRTRMRECEREEERLAARGLSNNQIPRDRWRMAKAAGEVSEQLRKTLAVLGAVRSRLAEEKGGSDSDVWVADRIGEVFTELCATETLGPIVGAAADAYLAGVRKPTSAEGERVWADARDLVADCLTVEVLSYAFAPPTGPSEPAAPAFRFLRLGADHLGPLFHKDQYAGVGVRKLYGVRFSHFGAFFNNEWRKSDYAWGRLDAAHHLLRLFDDVASDDDEFRLHTAILKAEIGQEKMRENLAELSRNGTKLQDNLIREQLDPDSLQRLLAAGGSLVCKQPRDAEGITRVVKTAVSLLLSYFLPRISKKGPMPRRMGARFLIRFTRHARDQLKTDEPFSLGPAFKKDLWSLVRHAAAALLLAALLGAGLALAIVLRSW